MVVAMQILLDMELVAAVVSEHSSGYCGSRARCARSCTSRMYLDVSLACLVIFEWYLPA